jgi:hypothetical protein
MSVDKGTVGLRPNTVLRSKREERGWGRLKAAREIRQLWQKHFPGAPECDSIVKSMRRHETGAVQVKDETYRKLYCLVYESSPQQLFGSVESERGGGDEFLLTSHKFIPRFVGAAAAKRLISDLSLECAGEQWLDCYKGSAGDSDSDTEMYVWPFGVVMFHVQEPLSLPSLAALSMWRQASYPENLDWAAERVQTLGCEDLAAPYVLSLYCLHEPLWTGDDLCTALHILSKPKVLLNRDNVGSLGHAELVESRLFAEGFRASGVVPFGVTGISLGYASWSAVVYYPVAPSRALADHELVACELATQALWAYSAYVNSEVERGRRPTVPDEYGWRFLRGMRSRLVNPRPQEDDQHRSMRNAVITTSETANLLDQAIEALRETDGG